jgi:hypothetical protein
VVDRPSPEQGHLVLTEGLFSPSLTEQIDALVRADRAAPPTPRVVFAHSGGPRTKTRAENRMWALLGAQVNSMSLAPEVVLANELRVPCCGLVVGHKYSLGDGEGSAGGGAIADSLSRASGTSPPTCGCCARSAAQARATRSAPFGRRSSTVTGRSRRPSSSGSRAAWSISRASSSRAHGPFASGYPLHLSASDGSSALRAETVAHAARCLRAPARVRALEALLAAR